MKKKICIIGTGGFAREVMCLIIDMGKSDDVLCFMEMDLVWEKEWKNKTIMGKPVWPQSKFDYHVNVATIGIGDPSIRKKVVNQLPNETEYISLIHPSAVISKWTEIGEGAIICAGCIVTCNIKMGRHIHLNLHTTIGHDCSIGNFVTTAPGANISGICNIGSEVYFGTSSATRQGVSICDNVIIGMGAMVVKNIKESGTYVGMPAKKIK